MARGRPQKLTDDLKKQVAAIKNSKSKKWTLRMIQGELRLNILESVKRGHPNWEKKLVDYEVEEQLPGISSIQKYIKSITQSGLTATSPLEKPWSVSKTPDLSPEAIAVLFDIARWLEEAKDNPFLSTIPAWTEEVTGGIMSTSVWPLSVREARWVARLYMVMYPLSQPEILYRKVKKLPALVCRQLKESHYRLWYAAKTYADYEQLCELSRTPFDTSRLDDALSKGELGKEKLDIFSQKEAKQ